MMEDFTFDHSTHLSITDLHSFGIRNTKALEEVFYDDDTIIIEITEDGDVYPVCFAIGFSLDMIPILYIFSFHEKVTSLFARKDSKSEIKSYFCGK